MIRGFYFNKITKNGLKIEDNYQLSYIYQIDKIDLEQFDSVVENEDFILCFNQIDDVLYLLKDEKNNIKQAILKTLFGTEVKLNEVDNYVQFLKLYKEIEGLRGKLEKITDLKQQNIEELQKELENIKNNIREYENNLKSDIEEVKKEIIASKNKNNDDVNHLHKHIDSKFLYLENNINMIQQNFSKIEQTILNINSVKEISEIKNEILQKMDKSIEKIFSIMQKISNFQEDIKEIDKQLSKKIDFNNVLFIYVKNKTKFALIKEIEFNKDTNVLFYSVKRVTISLETINKNILTYNYKDLYFYVSPDFNIKILNSYEDIKPDIKIIEKLLKNKNKQHSNFIFIIFIIFTFILINSSFYCLLQNKKDNYSPNVSPVISNQQIENISKKVTQIKENQKQILLKISSKPNQPKQKTTKKIEKKDDNIDILLNKIEE